MKRKLFTALLAGALIVSLSTAAFAGGSVVKMFYNGKEIKADASPVNMNGRILAPVRALAEAMGATVTWDKESNQVNITGSDQSAQISNLERALAPETSLKAVNSWAEGVKMRNGAWQYAIMTPDLKKASYDNFVSMNWSTGTSSPWVKSFDIKEIGKTDENTVRYSVKFTWTDSTNATTEDVQYITVKNLDGTWLVDSIYLMSTKGEIKTITSGDDGKIDRVFVKGAAAKEWMYEESAAVISGETKIYQGNTNVELKAEDLKEGSQIEVYYEFGPMILIYPPQVEAKEIRVF